jgi:hypothetical protein
MQSTNTVALDKNQYTNIWQIYRTHATVGCCVQTIRQCVFGGGLSIDGADRRVIEHFERLARSALDWILCIGLVPIVLRRDDVTGRMLPWVPQPETVDLFVSVDEFGQRSFQAKLKNDNCVMTAMHTAATPDARKTNVLVWAGCDFLPTVTGKIVTPITHLEATERFLHVLRGNALVASVLQSNPPLVSKSIDTKNSDTDGVMWNVADADVQEADYQKLKMTAESTRQEYELQQDNWGHGGGIPTTTAEMSDFSKRCRPHEYFLSAHRDLVRPQEPVVPPDLYEMTRLCDEKIYQIFGVPGSMFSNSNSKVQGHYMQVFSLNGNMKLAKKQVERFLQEVWTICKLTVSDKAPADDGCATRETHRDKKTFLSNAPDVVATDTSKKRRRGTDDTTSKVDAEAPGAASEGNDDAECEDDPFSEKCLSKSHANDVRLMGVPCLQQDDLMRMVGYGYVTDTEACNAARAMVGMPMLTEAQVTKQVAERAAKIDQAAEAERQSLNTHADDRTTKGMP